MGALTTESVQYAKLYTSKHLATGRDQGGPIAYRPFEHTHGVATAGDLVRLIKIPAGAIVVDFAVAWEAQVSTAVIIGTVDDPDRFHVSASWAAAGSQRALPFTGMLYQPTVDQIVLATFVTGNPEAAKKFAGFFGLLLP